MAIDWINAGCPIPDESMLLGMARVLRREADVRDLATTGPVRHLSALASPEEVARHPQGMILGMGAVH
jgi:hypothetical protein